MSRTLALPFFLAVSMMAAQCARPDARLLAVGGPGESSGSRGVGGSQADNSVRASGAIYLFE